MSEWRSVKPVHAIPGSCPAPESLGNAGWTVLHTAAAAYPNNPSTEQQEAMSQFITSWSKVYACSHCAYHMRTVLAKKPPVVTNKREVSKYVCELHNDVNYMLGKPVYDCSPEVVLKRWHPTYPSMDDEPTIEEQIAAEQRANSARTQRAGEQSVGGSRWGWNGAGSSTPLNTSTRRVADDETDVEAVLARLKGCQVYCPEKDAKH